MGTNKGARSSKFIALILRHDPSEAGITLDAYGYANVEALLNGMSKAGHSISHNDLHDIVASDDKQRYSFSEDQKSIRANQGHSIKVDLGLEEKTPPAVLFHGTATRFADAIDKEGLKPMSRQHVHLSTDEATATTVGSRHGSPIIYKVDTQAMVARGQKFYQSANGVWLIDHVAPEFLTKRQ